MSYGSDTALNMFPWVNVSSQTPSAGLRGTCPVQPAFSVLTSIGPGSLACSWTSCLGTGVVRLRAEVLTHSSSSPFLGSHAAPLPQGQEGTHSVFPQAQVRAHPSQDCHARCTPPPQAVPPSSPPAAILLGLSWSPGTGSYHLGQQRSCGASWPAADCPQGVEGLRRAQGQVFCEPR